MKSKDDDYEVENPRKALKKALKEEKNRLKQRVTQTKVLNFTSSKKLVGADFWNTISKLDNNDVIFTLNEPTHFRLNKIEFDGPVYHEESNEAGTNSTKKKRHGLAGALIGTVLLPGAGTIAGAIVGHGNGKNKGEHVNHIVTNRVEEPANIRLYLENTDNRETVIVGVLGKQTDYQELLNFQAPNETESAETGASFSEDAEVAKLREFKELLDDGVITQEEFEAKKKQLLDL